ncbi:MAG: ferritin [Bacteroidia bacterium]|nr:ferritin [Bacteroidia bacterium]MDW8158545.1 ferritin [Bacteroidia bacterium]
MKISATIQSLINEQINLELASAHLYMAMASYFLEAELRGFGNFFIVQVQEENYHAMKHFHFLHEVGGRLQLRTIEAPIDKFENPRHVFQIALEHEEKVTKAIYHLIDAALQEKDFATYTFLEWFVKEQIEEENLMRTILRKLEMIGDNTSALFFLNEELSKRSYEPSNGEKEE